jgi:hypothetical protein
MTQRERLLHAIALQIVQAFQHKFSETRVELFLDRTMLEVRQLMTEVDNLLVSKDWSVVEGWSIEEDCKGVIVHLVFQP